MPDLEFTYSPANGKQGPAAFNQQEARKLFQVQAIFFAVNGEEFEKFISLPRPLFRPRSVCLKCLLLDITYKQEMRQMAGFAMHIRLIWPVCALSYLRGD